jgi:hypothetical protein
MTAYVANYLKRKRILEKREVELVHAIRHDHSTAQLAKAAERLRDARMHVFKAKFSQDNPGLPPSQFEPTGEALEWIECSVDSIVAMYAPSGP